MIVSPDQADLSSRDTTTAEDSMTAYLASPTRAASPSSDIMIGDAANAYAVPPTDPYGYQPLVGPVNGYNPYTTATGVNLSTVPATGTTPAWSPCSTNCPSPGYILDTFDFRIWKKWRFTTIGEFHIYWNGTGSLDYDQGATSSIGVDVSADDDYFHFDRYVTYSETNGSETGPSGVNPRSAHLVAISLRYYKIKRVWAMVPKSNPVYPPPKNQKDFVCKRRWFIQQGGLYNPGDMWQYIVTGRKSLLFEDGVSGYLNDYPRSYHNANTYGANEHLCVSHGQGYTYGWAASFGGIGIQADTDHSADTQQCDYWGKAHRFNKILDKTSGEHIAWGSNKPAGKEPKIFYNY
jgi:hypothetical protein